MKECPYCKSEVFYAKEYVKGEVCYFSRFDGQEGDNTQLYDGLTHKLKSKYAWCADCHKRLFKIEE